jgi:hypothetical protein
MKKPTLTDEARIWVVKIQINGKWRQLINSRPEGFSITNTQSEATRMMQVAKQQWPHIRMKVAAPKATSKFQFLAPSTCKSLREIAASDRRWRDYVGSDMMATNVSFDVVDDFCGARRCRECGEFIPVGERVVDFLVEGGENCLPQWMNRHREWIHAEDCSCNS